MSKTATFQDNNNINKSGGSTVVKVFYSSFLNAEVSRSQNDLRADLDLLTVDSTSNRSGRKSISDSDINNFLSPTLMN